MSAANGFFEAAVVAVDEVVDEGNDVFFAVAQRGDEDGDDGETVVEVLAKLIFADGFFEIAVGGGDDAHVDLHVLDAADAADDLIFEDAQEFGLQERREFADFVEEEGAAVGGFEESFLHLLGVGECAFFVAEEFGFHESFGNGGAVDGDEGLFLARAFVVDGLGDEIFAGAALALNEDGGGFAGGDFADEVHELGHL